MSEISAAELKNKLEQGEALAVVDVREADEFASWHIHGSSNLPVYDALKSNDDEALFQRAHTLAKNRPIIIVCRMGVVSQKAAHLLRSLGFDATSLAGGIHRWGQVWSEAPIPCDWRRDMTFLQIRRNGKGCLSYFFGAHGEAAVLDPCVDLSAYTEAADREGLRVTHVFETHVHADHLSRARDLCRATGAVHVIPANQRVAYPFTPIGDGEKVSVGTISVEALATPGHTGESVCYLIDGRVLLTGDTLFVDSVGRPDLEKGDEGAEAGAKMLYQSLQERLLRRFDDLWIYPAHSPQPVGFDRSPVGASLRDVRSRLDLLQLDEGPFIRAILKSLTAKPPNYERIVAVNEGKAELDEVDPLDLEAGPNCCAAR